MVFSFTYLRVSTLVLPPSCLTLFFFLYLPFWYDFLFFLTFLGVVELRIHRLHQVMIVLHLNDLKVSRKKKKVRDYHYMYFPPYLPNLIWFVSRRNLCVSLTISYEWWRKICNLITGQQWNFGTRWHWSVGAGWHCNIGIWEPDDHEILEFESTIILKFWNCIGVIEILEFYRRVSMNFQNF